MEGAMFYWIGWSFWVILTFFINKQNPYRLKLSVVVLAIITISNLDFNFYGIDVYGCGLLILALSCLQISKEKRSAIIYYFICSFIMAISYVTFHLFELFDPIWIFFNKEWMMGICFCILSLLLQHNLKGRLLIIACGTMQGEILYSYFLSTYDFPYSIGSPEYLDVCMLAIAMITGWTALENAGSYFGNHFNYLGKTKQKSS